MLLGLLGKPTSALDARDLFGLPARPKRYGGASLDEIASVMTNVGFSSYWKFHRVFDISWLKAVARSFAVIPTMVWFGIRHPRTGESAPHFAVLTGLNGGGVQILDPLGPAPRGSASNIELNDSADSMPYRLAKRRELAILVRRKRSGAAR